MRDKHYSAGHWNFFKPRASRVWSGACSPWLAILLAAGAVTHPARAQVGGPTLIRNHTPQRWQGQTIRWVRDLVVPNKIDDLIDQSAEPTFEVVVNYKRCVEDADLETLRSLGPNSRVQRRLKYLSSVAVAGLTKDELAKLADRPEIAFIEQQFGFTTSLNVSLPNICLTPGPCSPNTVQEAFPGANGAGVNIAILDTGVDNGVHNAFAATPFIGGYNATATPPAFGDPDDDVFHGTHVASIALGQATTGTARGVAPAAGLIDVKVIAAGATCATPGQWALIVDGLETTYDMRDTWNVRVINMSLQQCNAAGFVPSDGLDSFSQLVDLAESMGIVVVAAASNNGPGNAGLPTPAAATRAITVAASETLNTTARGDDRIACFSSRGPRGNDGDADALDELKPEVAAPGTHLYDAFCNQVTGINAARWNTANTAVRLSGTSMAAPHVAGLAALIIQARPGINPASVKDLIISTATPMGPASLPAIDPVWNSASGWGLVNGFQAMSVAQTTDLTFPSHPPSPSWLSPDITTAPFPPSVGSPTTVTVIVTNRGPGAANNARIHFGVHVFSAATPTFFDIGTRIVTLPPYTAQPVSISWTPQNASHQCLKVEIGYGPDTDYSNNNAQRNLTVQNSPAFFTVQNTLTEEPAVVRLVPVLEDPRLPWDFALRPNQLTLSAKDCPQQVSVELFPPGNALPGQRQRVHVAAVIDTPFGPVTLGGVSVDAIKTPEAACLQIQCPSNLVVNAATPDGAKVHFEIPVVNQCDSQQVAVTCVPPSGSQFPVGPTAVSCMVRDEKGNEARCVFTVEVVRPKLTISRQPDRVLIFWIGDGLLQEADGVTGPWRDLPNAPNPLIVSPGVARRFYRLKLPAIQLPTFSVTGPGVTSAQFEVLAQMLGLPREAFQEPGHVQFLDPDKFQWIPTEVVEDGGAGEPGEEKPVAERILFDDLKRLPVMDEQEALDKTSAALLQARLLENPLLQATPFATHSRFEAVDSRGGELVNQAIDTQVGFRLTMGGLPMVGPGAKIKLAFDGRQAITRMAFACRLVKEGPREEALPEATAMALAQERFKALTAGRTGQLQLRSRLVLYAPPLELAGVQTLLPHYEFSGSFIPAGGGGPVDLRRFLLPAVQSARLVPTVTLDARADGRRVVASAAVRGGTGPYSYEWNSSTTILDPQAAVGPDLSYDIKETREGPFVEVVTVTVTDANGIASTASATLQIAQGLGAPVRPTQPLDGPQPVAGVNDVGTEWVGTSQGLGGSAGNAGGFVMRFVLDAIFGGNTVVRFNWGDYNAWEQDFKEPSLGGDDTAWIDNVDAAFYTGHANGDGWTFPGNHDDDFLHYTEARLGNNDLEWIVVAACGPLQPGTTPNRWWQRWGGAFRGLHLLCGYQTVTSDNTVEGVKWANYLLSGWTVRQAWMRTGLEVQGATEIVAVMGVLGPNSVSNWNDHYHGRGSVGPDITDIRGYWMVSSPCD